MGKSNSAITYIASTGTGIVIGTDIQLACVLRCSDLAGTVSLYAGSTLLLTMSADRAINFVTPIAIQGPVTMTSSAGASFLVGYKKSH